MMKRTQAQDLMRHHRGGDTVLPSLMDGDPIVLSYICLLYKCNIFTSLSGSVHEQNDDIFTATWLWLNEDNTVQVKKGYMRDILKVYRLTPP